MEAQVWLNQLPDQLPEDELAAPVDQRGGFILREPSAAMLDRT